MVEPGQDVGVTVVQLGEGLAALGSPCLVQSITAFHERPAGRTGAVWNTTMF